MTARNSSSRSAKDTPKMEPAADPSGTPPRKTETSSEIGSETSTPTGLPPQVNATMLEAALRRLAEAVSSHTVISWRYARRQVSDEVMDKGTTAMLDAMDAAKRLIDPADR